MLMNLLVKTYWYEGRFDVCARRAQAILRQRERWGYARHAYRDHLDLGSALEALGRYEAAERAYRRAARFKGRLQDLALQAIILTRIRAEDFDGARATLVELKRRIPRDLGVLLRSAIDAFEGKHTRCPSRILSKALTTGYFGTVGVFGFYACVVMMATGERDRAVPLLEKFVEQTSRNRREWGVTCRWELERARALLTRSERASETAS